MPRAGALDPRCRALPRRRSARLAGRARRRDPRVGALPAPRELVLRARDGLGAARRAAEAHFGERPDGTFTVVFRTRSDKAVRRAPGPGSRGRAPSRRAPGRAPAGPGDRLRRRDDTHSTCSTRSATPRRCGGLSQAARRRSSPGSRPSRPTSTRSSRRPPSRRGDRRPADAARAARRLRRLDRGRDPVLVAGCTIAGTLGLLYLIAHEVSMVAYVRNLVELIGLGLAVDYSLLVVHRYREELRRGTRSGRGGRAHDRHGGPGGCVLGRRRRNRARAPARRAGAVHPLDGDRRPSDPRRLRRSRAHPAAGASLLLRREARRPRARRRLLGPPAHASIMRRPRAFLAGGSLVLVVLALPAAIARAHAGIADGDPGVRRVGSRLRRAAGRARRRARDTDACRDRRRRRRCDPAARERAGPRPRDAPRRAAARVRRTSPAVGAIGR